jgi:hypothetical protein
MSTHIPWFGASTSDLCTLALVIQPVHSGKATELWERAKNNEIIRVWERLVLEQVEVTEAREKLAAWKSNAYGDRHAHTDTPLGVLADIVLREKLRGYSEGLFVRTVVPDLQQEVDGGDGGEKERGRVLEAAVGLGGQVGELAAALQRVWKSGGCIDFSDVEHLLQGSDDDEIPALLRSVVLYRKIFPSSTSTSELYTNEGVLSPPPSPSRKTTGIRLALKTALGSGVFDRSEVLEDARDRVVDMLFDFERAQRR